MSTNKKIMYRIIKSEHVHNTNIATSETYLGDVNQFIKFTYTVDNKNGGVAVLYNDLLFSKETKVKIDEIFFETINTTRFNGQSYDSISVYYTKGWVALLVEFEINSSKEWFVRKDEVGVYWAYEKAGLKGENNLESKLEVIQFDIKDKISYLIDKQIEYSHAIEFSCDDNLLDGFKKCIHKPRDKKFNSSLLLYKGAPLNRMKSDTFETIKEIQNQAYETVSVYFGTKLKNGNDYPPLIIKLTGSQNNFNQYYINKTYNLKSYWNKIDELSTENEDRQLITQLKRAQFDLFRSVLLLIDEQKIGQYGDEQFSQIVKENKMNSVMGRDIRVNKIDNNKFNCLISSNFKVYEHDISKSVVSYKYGSETVFGLRFFLHSGPNNSSNLKLYNKNTEFQNEEYIYYVKNKNTVSVFFYDMDPRPLLFCYNNQTFRPYSLEDYTKKWVTLQKVDNFSCGINTDNSKLLEVLLEVTYSVNLVEIDKGIKENCGPSTYLTQKLNNSEKTGIKINVSCSNMGSYKRYTHEPINPSYVLGEVSHGNNKLFNNFQEYNKALSKEHKNQFPRKVLSYYHINDLAYNYPLILVLEYQSGISNNSSDYYKLTRKIDPMKWEKMQNNNRDQFENNGDKEFLDEIQKFDNKLGQRPTENYDKNELNNVIGNKLKKIVENLGIDYTENSKGTNIPHSDKLNDSNSAAVAGTITTLSLAGAGGGFLFYKYQAIVMSFIRGLLH